MGSFIQSVPQFSPSTEMSTDRGDGLLSGSGVQSPFADSIMRIQQQMAEEDRSDVLAMYQDQLNAVKGKESNFFGNMPAIDTSGQPTPDAPYDPSFTSVGGDPLHGTGAFDSIGGNVGTSGQISGGGGGGGTTAATGGTSSTGGTLPGLSGGSGTGNVQPNFPGFQTQRGQPGAFLPSGGQQAGPGGFLPGQGAGGAAGGPVPMTQPNAQAGLQSYYNTPGYQLTEGQGAVDQFQTGPGYQFAVDEAMKQVQGNAASRGLLDSGAGLRAMTDRAQGMANQEYSNWQNRQQSMFGNYQNRLAGLASGPTGSQYAMQTGQGLGAGALSTGNDIASLLANQGNTLFGGTIGTGAAQAGNISQAGAQQAQILGANQATNLAAAAQGLF